MSPRGDASDPVPDDISKRPPFIRVVSDAGAGGYEAFPDVCRLQDGRLLCVFYAGYDHISLPNERFRMGGRICISVSKDEGLTWSPAKILYDGPYDDRDPSIVQLDNGRLVCNFFSLKPVDGTNGGYVGLGTSIMTSDDLGLNWSKPVCVSPNYYCSSPVRQLSDGWLILGLYAQTADQAWGAVIRSGDGGTNWDPIIPIDNAGMPLNAETDVIELADGTLFAVERSRGATMASSRSRDRGVTWSPSTPMAFPGACPYLHRGTNGIILLGHREPDTSIRYSLDECRTWSASILVDEVRGAYPSMVNLGDGSVLILYYDEVLPGSDIRARRFRATRHGLEWLPVGQNSDPSTP
jgi:sialidase-1